MDEAAFLQEARERYALALKEVEEDHADGKLCARFIYGGEGQWSAAALAARRPPDKPHLPVITWNLLQEPVNQVVNDSRAMNPSLQVVAMDGGDPDTAEFFQSRIRAIEYESDADIAYDTSAMQQVVSGFGFYRVRTDWKDYRSFEQRIVIEEIQNPFSPLVDPAARKYDRSDADYWFLTSRISAKEFIRKYGQDAYDHFVAFREGGDTWDTHWRTSDELMPEVEYWVREWSPDTLYEIEFDGERVVLLGRELPKHGLTAKSDHLVYRNKAGEVVAVPVLRRRKTRVPKVKQYIIDGASILDEHDWPGSIIPIIPVYGPQMIVDGRRRTKGLISDALDPQRLVNYTVSKIALLTSQISNTQYAVVAGQLQGFEDEWEPNSMRLFKQYRLYDDAGRQLPPPLPDKSEPPIQALTIQLGQAIDAVKKATAIYSASLGDRSNEVSGKAINARKVESDAANFHFQDNQARSRKLLGRILTELIPLVDAQQPVVPIRGEDGHTELIPVGQEFVRKGRKVKFDPARGHYDIAVRTGPSYLTQKEQATEVLLDMAQRDPNLMPIAGDKVYSGIPGCEEIADRYARKVIPPEFRPADEGQPELPPEARQILEQQKENLAALNEYARQLEAQLSEATRKLESKQMEIESRERIAALNADLERARLNLDAQKSAATLAGKEYFDEMKLMLAALKQRIDAVAADEPQGRNNAPDTSRNQGGERPERTGNAPDAVAGGLPGQLPSRGTQAQGLRPVPEPEPGVLDNTGRHALL